MITEQEKNVFRILSQSGEGEVVAGYIDRLAEEMVREIVDDEASTMVEMKAARHARRVLTILRDQFVPRGTMQSTPDRLD